MNEKCRAILAGFTGRKKRSKLELHRDLISKLHKRGCTYREIVRILTENFSLSVAPSTVFRFIMRLEKEHQKPRKTKPQKEKLVTIMPTVLRTPPPAPVASHDEIRRRIAALKQQTAQPESDKLRFEYDPDQPLNLEQEEEKA